MKRDRVWVRKSELRTVADTILKEIGKPKFGVCHGVRTGFENINLAKWLGADVIGTDLVAGKSVIEMDFHDDAPKWKNKADFVYSNSLDHSHNPDLAISRWVDCIRPGGLLLIHWDEGNALGKPTPSDCFRASDEEYMDLLKKYGSIQALRSERHRPNHPIRKIVKIVLFVVKVNK